MKGGGSCPKANNATCVERRSRNRAPYERGELDYCMAGGGEIPRLCLWSQGSRIKFGVLAGHNIKSAGGEMLENHIHRSVNGAEVFVNDLQRVPA